MTAQTTLAATPELTPLADFLAGVLKKTPTVAAARPGPHPGLRQRARRATCAPPPRCRPSTTPRSTATPPASEDLLGAAPHRPVRLNVVGDLGASSWRPVRVAPGTCFSVAAGAPLPAAADVVIPPASTDQGMAAVEIRDQPKRGHGVRRAGDELPAGAVLAAAGVLRDPGAGRGARRAPASARSWSGPARGSR